MYLSNAYSYSMYDFLIVKLEAHGLNRETSSLSKNYLQNSKLNIGSAYISWHITIRRVLQKSILGPLLCYIVIEKMQSVILQVTIRFTAAWKLILQFIVSVPNPGYIWGYRLLVLL